jgi:WD40-like Beta Propeller Repeat
MRTAGLLAMLLCLGLVTSGCGLLGKPCHDFALNTVRPDGSDSHRVKPNRSINVYDPVWLPGGQRLSVGRPCSRWSMDADGSDVRPEESRMFAGKFEWQRDADGRVTGFKAPGHEPIVYGSGYANLLAYSSEGCDSKDCPYDSGCGPRTPYPYDWPSVSPDGRLVAFTDGYDLHGHTHVFVASVDGGPRRRLAPALIEEDHPFWSPDGRKIAFRGDAGGIHGHENLYVINADGSDQRLIATETLAYAWSPDSRELVIEGGVPRGVDPASLTIDMIVVDLQGRTIHRIGPSLDSGGFSFSWSPANRIAYTYDKGDPEQDKCGS